VVPQSEVRGRGVDRFHAIEVLAAIEILRIQQGTMRLKRGCDNERVPMGDLIAGVNQPGCKKGLWLSTKALGIHFVAGQRFQGFGALLAASFGKGIKSVERGDAPGFPLVLRALRGAGMKIFVFDYSRD
jgi:hypothetical protein